MAKNEKNVSPQKDPPIRPPRKMRTQSREKENLKKPPEEVLEDVRMVSQSHPLSVASPFNIVCDDHRDPSETFNGDVHYALQISIVLRGKAEVIVGSHSRIYRAGEGWFIMCWEPHFFVSQMETFHRLLPEPLYPTRQKVVHFPAALLPLRDALGIVESLHLHGDFILQQPADPVQMRFRFPIIETCLVEFA